jgi:hypothetical protein
MKTDEICDRYASAPVGLTLRALPDPETGQSDTVLIEGRPDALRMLAELLLAVAEEEGNDGFMISPFGAGKLHFSSSATLGVYIHRINPAAIDGPGAA